jgi:hypothetical protein
VGGGLPSHMYEDTLAYLLRVLDIVHCNHKESTSRPRMNERHDRSTYGSNDIVKAGEEHFGGGEGVKWPGIEEA